MTLVRSRPSNSGGEAGATAGTISDGVARAGIAVVSLQGAVWAGAVRLDGTGGARQAAPSQDLVRHDQVGRDQVGLECSVRCHSLTECDDICRSPQDDQRRCTRENLQTAPTESVDAVSIFRGCDCSSKHEKTPVRRSGFGRISASGPAAIIAPCRFLVPPEQRRCTSADAGNGSRQKGKDNERSDATRLSLPCTECGCCRRSRGDRFPAHRNCRRGAACTQSRPNGNCVKPRYSGAVGPGLGTWSRLGAWLGTAAPSQAPSGLLVAPRAARL